MSTVAKKFGYQTPGGILVNTMISTLATTHTTHTTGAF
jgi:hypothetical protein